MRSRHLAEQKNKGNRHVRDQRPPVPDAVRQRAYLNDDDYQRLYRQSVENPDEFWGEQAKAFLDWFKPWHSVHHGDLRKARPPGSRAAS